MTRPVPAHLKVITGNAGRRGVVDAASLPPPTMPDPPAHLGDKALEEWRRICPELYALGILQRADMAQLAGYCVAYGRWVEAEDEILRVQRTGGSKMKGLLVVSPNGYPQMSPLLIIANKALEQVSKLASEFGLSPVSRARAEALRDGGKGGGDDEDRDPMEALLRSSERVDKLTG